MRSVAARLGVFVGRGVGDGQGVLVGVSVMVAVGWGVFVDAGVEVGSGAERLHADRMNTNVNSTENRELVFRVFIVDSFLK